MKREAKCWGCRKKTIGWRKKPSLIRLLKQLAKRKPIATTTH